jgi:hypothetical protein
MIHKVIIDAALRSMSLQMPEDVHREQLFVRKARLEVAQALMFQDRMFVVETAA